MYRPNWKNIKVKITVFVIAIFIWFFVEAENKYKYTFKIPIKYSNLSQGKIIVSEQPSFVKATLWGKGRELLALNFSQKVQYNFDLTNVNEANMFLLSKKNVRFSGTTQIEILNVVGPDSVYIEIEDIEKKKVWVNPEIKIIPLPGYTIVDGMQTEPDSVLIVGTKTGLDSVSFIRTEQLNYKKVKRDLREKIKLIDPKIKNVWLEQDEIYFFVDIQKLLEKPLVEIPINVINKPNRLEVIIIPSSLSLTLIGGVDLLLPITNKDITAYIDYIKVRAKKEIYYRAYIDKPDGVRIKDVKPKRFKVIVKKNKE